MQAKPILMLLLLSIAQATFSQTADWLNAQSQTSFANFKAFLAYTDSKSTTTHTNTIQLQQAKKAKLAALLAIPDPTVNLPMSFTNNTQLPVNLFPAEAFGGQQGEYREVQTGVQYNTTISQGLDIKLVNLEGWKNLQLAKINIEITTTDNQLNIKRLYENLATTYFNIVQLNAQLETAIENLRIADTLLQIVENKFEQGLTRQQDVNDSRVNQLNAQENIRQITYLQEQQYLALKIIADIPESEQIIILEKPAMDPPIAQPDIRTNELAWKNSILKEQSALTNLKKANLTFAPQLSLVGNNAYNQYNPDFTIWGGNWIHSQYVGLRFNFNLPNANTLSNRSKARFDYQLSQKNSEKAKIQSTLTQQQLVTEWDKAISQQSNNAKILALQEETFQKNKNLYNEGLIALDRTLNSFSAMVTARYNLIVSQVNVSLAQAKIEINNNIN
jgi:outer membrane protein TolC